MSYTVEDVKNTIKEHPAETVAAVAVVSLIGTIFYYRNKEKKAAIREAKRQRAIAPQFDWTLPSLPRRRKNQLFIMDFAA